MPSISKHNLVGLAWNVKLKTNYCDHCIESSTKNKSDLSLESFLF